MKVLSIRNSTLERLMPQAGITPFIHPSNLRTMYTKSDGSKLINIIGSKKPDFFFFLKDPGLTRPLLRQCKAASPKTKFVMWYGDFRNGIDACVGDKAELLDALLITNSDPIAINRYQQLGIPKVFTFYHGVSLDEFQPFDIPITHQVLFGGTNYLGRDSTKKGFPLSNLRKEFISEVHNKFRLIIYGYGWQFGAKKAVPRQQYAKVLRSAHINLGINHYDATRYYNRRLFESLGSGRMHLTYYVPGMEQDFLNRKNIVWFKSISEGISLIKYYLNNPEERETIAKNALSIIRKRHSYESRIVQLKGILESI